MKLNVNGARVNIKDNCWIKIGFFQLVSSVIIGIFTAVFFLEKKETGDKENYLK